MKLQKFFMGSQLQKKLHRTAKETFEKGGMGSDLPEIKLQRNKLKRYKILDFLQKIKF